MARYIDAYMLIAVWVVILIMLIISLTEIESRIAEDRINNLFEYLKEREIYEITDKAGEKEKTEYEEQQGKSRSEEGSGDPEA